MASNSEFAVQEYTVFHMFCGIGGGALGFQEASAQFRGVPGKFRNLGGIDSDPLACKDFEMLTGVPATCMDLFSREQYTAFHGKNPPEEWREATADDIRRAAQGVFPDVIFLSPPCKGLSGLLPTKNASSPKYQALNQLTVRGVKLAMDAFKGNLPSLLLFENVPRISSSRGAHLLAQIRGLLESYGYVINEGHHDCGEIGGLGQHRRRFLLIARNTEKLKNFVYKPPKLRVKSIGEVIGELPMPDDPAAGSMHRLPRLQWITWLRLALIPPSGDHRDLAEYGPGKTQYSIVPVGEAGPAAEVLDDPVLGYQPRGGGSYGVQDWNKPAATVVGNARINGSNAAAVADVRLRQTASRYSNKYQVVRWNETSPCVAGTPDVQAGAPSVADIRVPEKKNRHHSHFRVVNWDEACGTVTGATHVANGAACVADVRVSDNNNNSSNNNKKKMGTGYNGSPGLYGVIDWSRPAPTISGSARVSSSNCPAAVADPRIQCKQRNGAYGVQEWNEPASTVTGAGDIHSVAAAVADPRIPEADSIPEPPPVIISADGSWHRPVTTLELAVLQSLPPVLPDGRPLVLAGRSEGKWRERIGNMVPKEAGKAIANQILMALIPNSMGQWVLGSTEIWVKKKEEVREIHVDSVLTSAYQDEMSHISGTDRFGTA